MPLRCWKMRSTRLHFPQQQCHWVLEDIGFSFPFSWPLLRQPQFCASSYSSPQAQDGETTFEKEGAAGRGPRIVEHMHQSSCKYEKNWPMCVDDDWVSNEPRGQQGSHRQEQSAPVASVLLGLSLGDDGWPFILGQHGEASWGKARSKAELQWNQGGKKEKKEYFLGGGGWEKSFWKRKIK